MQSVKTRRQFAITQAEQEYQAHRQAVHGIMMEIKPLADAAQMMTNLGDICDITSDIQSDRRRLTKEITCTIAALRKYTQLLIVNRGARGCDAKIRALLAQQSHYTQLLRDLSDAPRHVSHVDGQRFSGNVCAQQELEELITTTQSVRHLMPMHLR